MFLYLINENNTQNYKIGISRNHPAIRKNNLQTGNSKILHIIKFWKIENQNTETYLHKYFSSKRIHREWFKLEQKDIEYLYNYFDQTKMDCSTEFHSAYVSELVEQKVKHTDYNREVNDKKIDEIYKYYKECIEQQKSPHVDVIIINFRDNGYYIIDGQHRYEALKKIFNKGYNLKIMCKKYQVSVEEEKEIFKITNSGRYTSLENLKPDKRNTAIEFMRAIEELKLDSLKNTLFDYDSLLNHIDLYESYKHHLNKNDFVPKIQYLQDELKKIFKSNSTYDEKTIIEKYNWIIKENSYRLDDYRKKSKHKEVATIKTIKNHIRNRVINNNYLFLTNIDFILDYVLFDTIWEDP